MAKNKPGGSLAAFSSLLNPATMKSATQPVVSLYIPDGQLEVFAAQVDAQFPGVVANVALTRNLGPDGVTPMTVYAVIWQKKGNNIQIYFSGKGSAAGACAKVIWPLEPAAYNVLAKKIGQPLLDVPVVVKAKPVTRRKRKAAPLETQDSDRATA